MSEAGCPPYLLKTPPGDGFSEHLPLEVPQSPVPVSCALEPVLPVGRTTDRFLGDLSQPGPPQASPRHRGTGDEVVQDSDHVMARSDTKHVWHAPFHLVLSLARSSDALLWPVNVRITARTCNTLVTGRAVFVRPPFLLAVTVPLSTLLLGRARYC